MKINNLRSAGLNPYKNQMNKMEFAERAAKNKKDSVQISAEAKVMQQETSFEIERQNKIDELSARVKNGTYELEPTKIAEGIIDYFKN